MTSLKLMSKEERQSWEAFTDNLASIAGKPTIKNLGGVEAVQETLALIGELLKRPSWTVALFNVDEDTAEEGDNGEELHFSIDFTRPRGENENHGEEVKWYIQTLDTVSEKSYFVRVSEDLSCKLDSCKGDIPDDLLESLRTAYASKGLDNCSYLPTVDLFMMSIIQEELEALLKKEGKLLSGSIVRRRNPMEYVAVPTDLHFQEIATFSKNGLITTFYDGGFLFGDGSYIQLGIEGCIAPVSIMDLLGMWCFLCEYSLSAPPADKANPKPEGRERFIGYNDFGNVLRGNPTGGGGLTPSYIDTLRESTGILKRTFAIIRHPDGREEKTPLILVERELVKGEFEVQGQKVKNGFILTKAPLMEYFKKKGFVFNIKSAVFMYKRNTKLNQSLTFKLASSAGACHNLGNKMVIGTKELRQSLGKMARTKQGFKTGLAEVLENFSTHEGDRFMLSMDKKAGKIAVSEKKAFRKVKKS